MIEFDLSPRAADDGRPLRFLFIGAHSDDLEIGCGGTAIELAKRYPDAEFHWVVLSAGPTRDGEAKTAPRKLLGRAARRTTITVADFPTSFFPAAWADIKRYLETLKAIEPDVVFAHTRDEFHQDHKVVGELVWNTFRNHLILEFEIPKYEGGLGAPCVFVPVSASAMRRKVAVLMDVFATQRSKQWFTAETFEGLMRLRGIECNSPSGYAEAFYARKVVLATGSTR